MGNVVWSGTSKNFAVIDRSLDEYLLYHLEIEGATAQFSFGCSHRLIKSAADFPGHPKGLYEWEYFREPSECDETGNVGDVYSISMLFISARKYHLKVEHRKSDDSVIAIVSDLVCQSDDPQGVASCSLEIFCLGGHNGTKGESGYAL